MNSHELAKKLLKAPAQKVTASVDISTGDEDATSRAFGDLYSFQLEPDGTVTLLFADGTLNK